MASKFTFCSLLFLFLLPSPSYLVLLGITVVNVVVSIPGGL